MHTVTLQVVQGMLCTAMKLKTYLSPGTKTQNKTTWISLAEPHSEHLTQTPPL